MLEEVQLPGPWIFVASLGSDGQALDRLLFGSRSADPIQVLERAIQSSSWDKLCNSVTNKEVVLQLTNNWTEVRITAAIFMSGSDDSAVSGTDLRSLPIAAIESAATEFLLPFRSLVPQIEPPVPRWSLKTVKKTADFLPAVAHHFLELKRLNLNPAAELSRANQVALSTAQSWITAARKAGLLPPGRPGRMG